MRPLKTSSPPHSTFELCHTLTLLFWTTNHDNSTFELHVCSGIPRLFQSVDTHTQHKGNAMPSLILHTAIADALGECFQLLAQSLKAVLIEALERWMVPLRNSLDHFGARRVLVVVVVDNNAAILCDLSMLLFGISGGL